MSGLFGRAIFLHTGWRSGGTWVWSRLREQPGATGFYEPLHEQLERLRAGDIPSLRPGSWASNHSETPPYFQEFLPLLRAGHAGVPRYRRRFAFDNFFLEPDASDPELEGYLGSLLAAPGAGQVSVLKFCRSLGRVGWMQRRFPDALHAVVLRDPISQFASAEWLMTARRNRYFAIAPVLVLARNARHGLVAGAVAALDVRLPTLHSDDLSYGFEACWRHVRRLDAAGRYRLFLAFWAAAGVAALRSTALVVEPGRMNADAVYRGIMEAAFRAALPIAAQDCARPGPALSLLSEPAVASPRTEPPGVAEAHSDARAWISGLDQGSGFCAQPDRLATLLGCLGDREVLSRRRLAPARPEARSEPTRQTPVRRLATALQVLFARVLQPVRRIHGRLVRHQTGRQIF